MKKTIKDVEKAKKNKDVEELNELLSDENPEVSDKALEAIDELAGTDEPEPEESEGDEYKDRDFKKTPYISDKWKPMTLKEAKQLEKEGKLFGYNPSKGLGIEKE